MTHAGLLFENYIKSCNRYEPPNQALLNHLKKTFDSETKNPLNNPGAIVGMTLGGIILIGIIVGVVIFMRRKNHRLHYQSVDFW